MDEYVLYRGGLVHTSSIYFCWRKDLFLVSASGVVYCIKLKLKNKKAESEKNNRGGGSHLWSQRFERIKQLNLSSTEAILFVQTLENWLLILTSFNRILVYSIGYLEEEERSLEAKDQKLKHVGGKELTGKGDNGVAIDLLKCLNLGLKRGNGSGEGEGFVENKELVLFQSFEKKLVFANSENIWVVEIKDEMDIDFKTKFKAQNNKEIFRLFSFFDCLAHPQHLALNPREQSTSNNSSPRFDSNEKILSLYQNSEPKHGLVVITQSKNSIIFYRLEKVEKQSTRKQSIRIEEAQKRFPGSFNPSNNPTKNFQLVKLKAVDYVDLCKSITLKTSYPARLLEKLVQVKFNDRFMILLLQPDSELIFYNLENKNKLLVKDFSGLDLGSIRTANSSLVAFEGSREDLVSLICFNSKISEYSINRMTETEELLLEFFENHKSLMVDQRRDPTKFKIRRIGVEEKVSKPNQEQQEPGGKSSMDGLPWVIDFEKSQMKVVMVVSTADLAKNRSLI